jgi:hypothetical protein
MHPVTVVNAALTPLIQQTATQSQAGACRAAERALKFSKDGTPHIGVCDVLSLQLFRSANGR